MTRKGSRSVRVSFGICESFEATYISAFTYFQAETWLASHVTTCNAVLQKVSYGLGVSVFPSLWILYICIHIHFNSSQFKIKKHSSVEIWRALKLGFILRVPVFTHFWSGFQCGNSSYEGHFAMCLLYALWFMIYFMGIKQ